MVSLNLQVVNTGNIGCMPLCKLKKICLLINAPPPNEKCPGNESKNYGMYVNDKPLICKTDANDAQHTSTDPIFNNS
jgi:hypothetical protein